MCGAVPIQTQISESLQQWDASHPGAGGAGRKAGAAAATAGGHDRDRERKRDRARDRHDRDRDRDRERDRRRSRSPPAAGGDNTDWRDSKRFKGKGPPRKEMRQDPSDGQWYTKASFIEVYGGTKQWEAAEETSRK